MAGMVTAVSSVRDCSVGGTPAIVLYILLCGSARVSSKAWDASKPDPLCLPFNQATAAAADTGVGYCRHGWSMPALCDVALLVLTALRSPPWT